MNFVVIYNQGNGCDYTIGCGINSQQFTAPSWEHAVEFVKKEIAENYRGERELEKAELFEVSLYANLPLKLWKQEMAAADAQAEERAAIARDRAELARLRALYEPAPNRGDGS